jgi:3',5'-nucleoside bisphosphate phosphatase
VLVDLHIHTVATPHHASWEPEGLVLAAKARGLSVIAVTDHNTMGSAAGTLAAGERHGLQVIPGVEVDSGFALGGAPGAPLRLWHTLVYGVDPADPGMRALCAEVYTRNLADAARLRGELAGRGFVLPGLDALGRPANVADVGTALGRGNALPGRVGGDDDEAAGMRYILHEVAGGYQPVGVDEVIDAAHRAGGVAVLAHPGRAKGIYAVPATADDIAAMAARGLDGVEVFYPSHDAERRAFLLAMASRHSLLVSGGSDSHHPSQGLAAWPAEALAALLARLGL